MNAEYLKQAALVVSCIPTIAAEERFAIKGGTGINLFELNLPRLSVDIDLTYTIVNDRETAIRDINDSLERIAKGLCKLGIDAKLSGTPESRKIYCARDNAFIKIEPNFILRGTILPTRKLKTCPGPWTQPSAS